MLLVFFSYYLFLFVFSNSQTTSTLISGYQGYGYTPEFPIADKNNGGPQLYSLFQNLFGSFGMGRSAFIRPDKTWKRISSYSSESSFTSDMQAEGCKLSDCDVTYSLTVNGGDDCCFFSFSRKPLETLDWFLPISETEWRIVKQNIFVGDAQRQQICYKYSICRARINVVCAGKNPSLDPLLPQVIGRRQGLLVGYGAGVNDVF